MNVARRDVHFEAWAVHALAESLDPELRIAAGPHTEDELRVALERHADASVRARGLAALGSLEAARDAVAAASPDELDEALAGLDAVFVELTERDPTRNPGMAYGARTLCYLDCLRDLDVTMGPGFVEEVAPALEVLFEAGRWYSGRVASVTWPLIESSLPEEGRGPFGPVVVAFCARCSSWAPIWRPTLAAWSRSCTAGSRPFSRIPTRRRLAAERSRPSPTLSRDGGTASSPRSTCR
jgi:hypothetical protein